MKCPRYTCKKPAKNQEGRPMWMNTILEIKEKEKTNIEKDHVFVVLS